MWYALKHYVSKHHWINTLCCIVKSSSTCKGMLLMEYGIICYFINYKLDTVLIASSHPLYFIWLHLLALLVWVLVCASTHLKCAGNGQSDIGTVLHSWYHESEFSVSPVNDAKISIYPVTVVVMLSQSCLIVTSKHTQSISKAFNTLHFLATCKPLIAASDSGVWVSVYRWLVICCQWNVT